MKLGIVIAIALGAARAHAGPLADALARHAPEDVETLRRAADPASRCTLGAIYAQRGDLPHAALYLDGCDAAELDPDISEPIVRLFHDVNRKLRASELSPLSIVTNPAGMVAETDALPGERFATPATVWARAGTYRVRAAHTAAELDGKALENTIKLDAHSRGSVVIDASAAPATAPRDGHADFREDNATEAAESGPPPAVKRGSLVPQKYIDGGTTGGPQIDDPFPQRRVNSLANDGVGRRSPWSFGMRVGGGLFEQSGVDMRAGLAIAAVARLKKHLGFPGEFGKTAIELRVDWSQRGGAMGHVDALGATLGPALLIIGTGAVDVRVGLGARGEVRLEDMLGDAPVNRFGLDAAAWLDIEPTNVPVIFGLRVEEGITELIPGARDRAVIAQVGFNVR